MECKYTEAAQNDAVGKKESVNRIRMDGQTNRCHKKQEPKANATNGDDSKMQ